MLKLLKNKKGSGEIIAFILVLPLLLLPIFNTVHTLKTILKYDNLRQVGRATIIQMETDGGLKADQLINIKAKLEEKGFDTSKIDVDYTPYPAVYGDEVRLKLSYTHSVVSYTINFEGGLKRNEENIQMVFGPVSSVSKKYLR